MSTSSRLRVYRYAPFYDVTTNTTREYPAALDNGSRCYAERSQILSEGRKPVEESGVEVSSDELDPETGQIWIKDGP